MNDVVGCLGITGDTEGGMIDHRPMPFVEETQSRHITLSEPVHEVGVGRFRCHSRPPQGGRTAKPLFWGQMNRCRAVLLAQLSSRFTRFMVLDRDRRHTGQQEGLIPSSGGVFREWKSLAV
jgi:hypothetical protein